MQQWIVDSFDTDDDVVPRTKIGDRSANNSAE